MREPTEEEVLRLAVKSGLATVFTSLPALVVSYDKDAKTIVAQPAVHNGTVLPPLTDVPFKFPRGGGYRLVWEPAAGDEVTLLFYKLDPSRFRVSGEISKANLKREHGFYPVALPGSESELLADYAPASEGLHIGTDDGTTEIVVTPTQIKLGSTNAASPAAKGDVADANFTALNTWLAAHVHPVATLGSPTGPSPAPPPPPTPTVASKVLVE